MGKEQKSIDLIKIQKLESEPFIRVCKEREVYYEMNRVNGPEMAVDLLREVIDHASVEVFVVACLDVKNKVKAISIVSKGSLSAAIVDPKVIIQLGLAVNASSIIVGHNHPSGDTQPSMEDTKITSRLDEATKLIGLKLLDHLIITDDSYYSFKENDNL